MNAHDNFAGTGIRQAFAEPPEADDLMTEALAEALNKDVPPATPDTGLVAVFQRQLAVRREEKARHQAIAASALAKSRELTVSIRSLEDALDALLVSEVAT